MRNKCKLRLFREGAGDSRDRCGGECREISITLRRRRATRREINGGNCNATAVMRCIGDKNMSVLFGKESVILMLKMIGIVQVQYKFSSVYSTCGIMVIIANKKKIIKNKKYFNSSFVFIKS